MKVVLASPRGACYGVERALDLVHQAAQDSQGAPVFTLGPLIHNPIVVGELEQQGVRVAEQIGDCAGRGTLVIRSHGVPAKTIDSAREAGLTVVDATCPHVERAQRRATQLAEQGRFVVIVGEPGHPEVEAILSYAGPNALVVQDVEQVERVRTDRPIGVVVQTTQPRSLLDAVVERLSERYEDIEVHNTICSSTRNRQEAAMQVAATVDAMVVVGGRNSGNTRRLFEICSKHCANTHHIESASEIDPQWFEGCSSVGVTAGASTPQSHIAVVADALERL